MPSKRETGPVGVLALQGSFSLHLNALEKLHARGRSVRKAADLEGISGLILPGGESTVMSLLMEKYGLFQPIRDLARRGLPMMGTCAGAILLGKGEGIPPRLAVTSVEFLRNAYGTQTDSFTAELDLAPFDRPFHGVFIRAPRIVTPLPPGAKALGEHDGCPVLVEAGNLILTTFHPELTEDLRLHDRFLALVRGGGDVRRGK